MFESRYHFQKGTYLLFINVTKVVEMGLLLSYDEQTAVRHRAVAARGLMRESSNRTLMT